MPEKLHRCVDDVTSQGNSEDSAWAICKSSIDETEMFFSFEEPNDLKVEEAFQAFTHSSSFVGNVRYDPDTQKMHVLLNGKGYDLCGISQREYDAFEGATSKGSYFNRILKGNKNCGIGEITNPQNVPEINWLTTQWPPQINGEYQLPPVSIYMQPNIPYPPVVENVVPNSLSGIAIGAKPYRENESTGQHIIDPLGAASTMQNEEGHNIHKSISGIPADYETRPEDLSYTIKETMSELQSQFRWMSPDYIARAKAVSSQNGGAVLLIRAAAETITDHRAGAPPGTLHSQYRRLLSSNELMAMARTATSKGADINHYGTSFQTNGVVLDSEFDPERKEIQMIVYEQDPEIIAAIQSGQLNQVSINGGSPRNTVVTCSTGECFAEPRGVILGEKDNIAFAYVVTDPNGMRWRGQVIPYETPGIKTTKIEIL
jgi:hypothetical protein